MSSAPTTTENPSGSRGFFRAALEQTGWVLGRSMFPFVALAIILGTMIWGPWVSLVLALAWWKVVTRIG